MHSQFTSQKINILVHLHYLKDVLLHGDAPLKRVYFLKIKNKFILSIMSFSIICLVYIMFSTLKKLSLELNFEACF